MKEKRYLIKLFGHRLWWYPGRMSGKLLAVLSLTALILGTACLYLTLCLGASLPE